MQKNSYKYSINDKKATIYVLELLAQRSGQRAQVHLCLYLRSADGACKLERSDPRSKSGRMYIVA